MAHRMESMEETVNKVNGISPIRQTKKEVGKTAATGVAGKVAAQLTKNIPPPPPPPPGASFGWGGHVGRKIAESILKQTQSSKGKTGE